ncbi:MAG: gas vesicle protein [Planctomycetaceae bacterium]|jgi:hypothetical protein|nr:gas vesicle protein [Phycisphaerales bacterium]MCE2653030.1 gas vesicle protein [Planctomycetaceae bacterium]
MTTPPPPHLPTPPAFAPPPALALPEIKLPAPKAPEVDPDQADAHLTLCEALDRLLTTGVVLRGEVCIAVANVELVYLGLHVLLASVPTARRYLQGDCPSVGTARSGTVLAPISHA